MHHTSVPAVPNCTRQATTTSEFRAERNFPGHVDRGPARSQETSMDTWTGDPHGLGMPGSYVRRQQIEKLKVKRAGRMGHGLFSVAEIAADSFIVRMGQPTAALSERQVAARGLPHDSVVWLGAKRSRGVFDNALTAAEARRRPSWYKMNHALSHSHTCNVEMRYNVMEGLGWWARRKIAPPEQLFYDYGEAPSSWT